MADITMTREAGPNRTFRSIFGDETVQHDDGLKLEQEQSGGTSDAVLIMDDDDEALWNDEPPSDGSATAIDNNDMAGLQFAQRKSMEEWADDDEEEENWKDALQDRVNQLELALQHQTDATIAETRHSIGPQQEVEDPENHGVDFSQSLPVASQTPSPGAGGKRSRHASRHKMQRTSSLHACITGDTTGTQHGVWNNQRKAPEGKVGNLIDHNIRSRATSIDFVARNIETVEHHRKRSGSLSGACAAKTDSPRHSVIRKKGTDRQNTSPSERNRNRLRGTKAAVLTSSGAAVSQLSETESIRRYVLDDVKHMSMERLVSDAQRLQFLENYYQNRQASGATPLTTSSTTVAPTSPASSSSPMSTS